LTRPLSLLDYLYSAELSTSAALLAPCAGSRAEHVQAIAAQAVYGCGDRGAKRTASEAKLLDIRPRVETLNHPQASGDLWSAVAHSHALSCRWAQVPDAVQLSVCQYRDSTYSSGFEIANTRWLTIWAYWNLGRWNSLCQTSDEMLDDATQRSDTYQRLMVSHGLGCAAWLARDRTRQWDRICRQDQDLLSDESNQMFHLFGWIASLQRKMYGGEFAQAWNDWTRLQPQLGRLPFRRLQWVRVLGKSLGSLLALHRRAADPSPRWARQAATLIGQLRREQLPYATMLANLHHGLLHLQQSESKNDCAARAARTYLQAAGRDAKTQRLRPFSLAADDALARLETGQSLGLLRERLQRRGVERPSNFERLYTVGQ
jgi:hypothetical protein